MADDDRSDNLSDLNRRTTPDEAAKLLLEATTPLATGVTQMLGGATGEEKILWRSRFSSVVVLLRVIFALCLEAEGRFPLPIYALAVPIVPRFSGAG